MHVLIPGSVTPGSMRSDTSREHLRKRQSPTSNGRGRLFLSQACRIQDAVSTTNRLTFIALEMCIYEYFRSEL